MFAARGYHDVGIDDIGAAAGISGPGVYRHFASKQALLEALCDRAMSRMLDGARSTRDRHDDPGAALEALVDLHVEFAVAERPLLGVWVREQRALSDDVRRSLRRRSATTSGCGARPPDRCAPSSTTPRWPSSSSPCSRC